MKRDTKTSALRKGIPLGFDSAMKNEECKPSLKDKLFRVTSPEFQLNHNAGMYLGRTVAENLKLAIRRNELAEFILKETYHKKSRNNLSQKSR